MLKEITPEVEADIVRRYLVLEQPLSLIRFALDLSPARIRAVLVKHDVQIRKAGPGKDFVHWTSSKAPSRAAARA